MSLSERLIAIVIAIAVISGIGRKLHHSGYVAGKAEVAAQWQAERVALKEKVEQQAARNRDMQREAEKRYTVQTQVRDRFIVKTIREVRHETDNLAACVLTPAARGLLNAASRCASEDRAASCGAE